MKRILLPVLLLSSGLAQAQPPQPVQQAQSIPLFADRPADRTSVAVTALIERLATEMDREFIFNPELMRGMAVSSLANEADFESLRGILRASGFVAVEMDDQIHVVNEVQARSLPTRVLNEDDRRVSDHEVVTRIIALPEAADGEGLQAAQLVPILRPMMPQNAMLGAPTGANKLIVVDYYDNVRRITTLVEGLLDN